MSFKDKLIQALKAIRWRMADLFLKNNPPSHLQKQALIYRLSKKYAIPLFIETGTFLGEMISAHRNTFPLIYSIELDEKLANNAKIHFNKFDHIHILQGDSSEVLPQILEKENKNALFWLDGHYSEGITAKGMFITPILKEVEIISRYSQVNTSIIVIDDLRLFNGSNDYPNREAFIALLKMHFPLHTISMQNDAFILSC